MSNIAKKEEAKPMTREELIEIIRKFVDRHDSLQGSQYRMSDYCTSRKEETKCLAQQNRDIVKLADAILAQKG